MEIEVSDLLIFILSVLISFSIVFLFAYIGSKRGKNRITEFPTVKVQNDFEEDVITNVYSIPQDITDTDTNFDNPKHN